MKITFTEEDDFNPTVEIDSELPVMGSVVVSFFDYNDDAEKIYKPSIWFGKLGGNEVNTVTPDESAVIGGVWMAASQIAQRMIPPYVGKENRDVIASAFMRVEELREANGC